MQLVGNVILGRVLYKINWGKAYTFDYKINNEPKKYTQHYNYSGHLAIVPKCPI